MSCHGLAHAATRLTAYRTAADEIDREVCRISSASRRGASRRLFSTANSASDEELGVPVFQAGRGHYGIDRKFFLPPLRLSVPEAIVLFLASRLIARWSDQYDAAVVSAFTKLADALPQPRALAQRLDRQLTLSSSR